MALFAALVAPGFAQSESITIDASTTFAPFLADVVQTYRQNHPEAILKLTNLGSRAGISAVESHAADVAFVDSTPAVTGALISRPVFAVPLAIVADPRLGISNLSRAQIAGLFKGAYTSWKEVGGPDVPVKPLTRPPQSAMSLAFVSTFGGVPSAGDVLATSQEAADAVRATPGGIAFVTLESTAASGLRPIAIDGHDAAGPLGTLAYPFFAYGYAVTSGPPAPELSRFLAFVETRRALLAKYGIVSARDLVR